MIPGSRGRSRRAGTSGNKAARAPGHGVYLFYRASAELLRRLPRRVAAQCAGGAARALASALPGRRAIVADNLARVLGPETSPSFLARVVRDAFSSYGRYWADAARLDASRPNLLERRWSIEGSHYFLDPLERGQGVVLALPHLGSWEIGAVWAASMGHPLTTVVEPAEPEELFDWLVGEREALGIRVLPLGGSTASELAAVLRDGGAVALLADRDIAGDGIEVEFFGQTTRLPAGPAVLALRSGAALLPCAVYHTRKDYHHAVILPPIDTERRGRLREDATRVTKELAACLELLIRRAPEQWHVFQPNWPNPQQPPGSSSTNPDAPDGSGPLGRSDPDRFATA